MGRALKLYGAFTQTKKTKEKHYTCVKPLLRKDLHPTHDVASANLLKSLKDFHPFVAI